MINYKSFRTPERPVAVKHFLQGYRYQLFSRSDAFTERDMRVMISVGIAMPQGTL